MFHWFELGPGGIRMLRINFEYLSVRMLLFEYYSNGVKWVKINLQDFTLTNEPEELDL